MQQDFSYQALGITTNRRNMLRFIWLVIGGLLFASYALPFVIKDQHVFALEAQLAFFAYLMVCFILSRWSRFYRLTQHLLMSGLLVMFVSASMANSGINTPASHFLPLIPALCSLFMSARETAVYAVLVSLGIAALAILHLDFSIRHASTLDLLNAFTLVLSTVVITAGSLMLVEYNNKLIHGFRGKASFDQLTGLPNRYFLRNRFDEMVSEAFNNKQPLPGLMAIGIDDFQEYRADVTEEDAETVLVQTAHTIASLTPGGRHFSLGIRLGSCFTAVYNRLSDEEANYISHKIQAGFKALNIVNTHGEPMSLSVAILRFAPDKTPPRGSEALRMGHEYLASLQARGPQQIHTFDV